MRQAWAAQRLPLVTQRALIQRPPQLAGLASRVKSAAPARGTTLPSRSLLQARCLSSSVAVRAAPPPADFTRRKVEMGEFPPERIRNLSIIAHIDHGKSTLADRLLQMTNTLPPAASPQFLDKLKVERERGITVKAQTVSIIHTHTDGQKYLINLIDTPGHVDFSYEVSRSLGACEGGLLLVDCTQGIQAQTLSVFHHALEADLKLLPVINKVDLQHASPEETSEQIASSLGLPKEDHMRISAKSGLGVEKVLEQIVEGLPAPSWEGDDNLRALVFDTFYDRFRGVVSLVRIVSGSVKKGDKVRFLQAGKKYEVLDVGIYNPEEVTVDALGEGQVGYLVCSMKNSDEAYIGDTVCWADKPVEPLPGFQPMKAMVYAGVFPMDGGEFPLLEESINRLTLNDRSVSVERESSAALSQGFRLGFLGSLHMDVFRQRLEDEYSSSVIVTAPTVPYKVVYLSGKEEYISNPAEFPDVTDTKTRVAYVEEPMVNATIFVPNEYIGAMMELCSKYRGIQQEYKVLDGTDRAILRYQLPLSEIVTDFFSDLKGASSGFASFDYEEAGYEQSNLVKLNMLLNGKPVDALAMIVHRNAAQQIGRAWTKKLKEVLPKQLFELAIQAAVGQRVVARETLSAMRKDVTAGLYGGHYERKMKHLNKQKEGKKRLKSLAGNINIPQTAFYQVLSSRPRAFSTSARQMLSAESSSGNANDWLAAVLPALQPTELPHAAPQPTAPFPRHHISPQQRAGILSGIARQVAIASTPHLAPSSTTRATSEPLVADFMKLYLTSPAPLFTAPELQSVARAVHAIDRRHKSKMRAANERLVSIVDALRDVVGNESATKGLELAILVSSSRFRRHVTLREVHRAERTFADLFPKGRPNDPGRLIQYQRSINHILYLCALSHTPSRLNMWWNRMTGEGLQADSWSYMARIMVHGLMKRTEATLLELESCLPKVNDKDAVALTNSTMWLAARVGRWDVVDALFTPLHGRLPANPFLQPPVSETLTSHLARLRPSRETYAMLIAGHAHAGDLMAALRAMRNMFDDGHVPGVTEYTALFKGFARFGAVPHGQAGEATSAFPLWLEERPRAVSVTDHWAKEGQFTSNFSPTASSWTHSALVELLGSLLSLPPPSVGDALAPPPKALYTALLAVARTTNADGESVRDAWAALETKFGPNNTQGWKGWRVDSRLTRVVGRVGAGRQPEDEVDGAAGEGLVRG